MSTPRPCSEFPNANTALHDGAIFGCATPLEPWEPEAWLEEDDQLPTIVEFDAFHTETALDLEAEGFAKVVEALLRIAAELGGEAGPKRVQDAISGQVPLPPSIAFALHQWRTLLDGAGEAVPDLTLDAWAAGFLSTLFGPTGQDHRARVRSEGIAAFGVLDAA